MAVGTFHDDFLAIDKQAILFVTIILVTVFYGAETKFLTFHMEGFTLWVF